MTPSAAYALLEELRWGNKPACPHCDSERVHYIAPANGVSRKTRTGSLSERRVWKCGDCHRQFSVLTGTTFHGTKVSPVTILRFLEAMADGNVRLSARTVAQRFGVNPQTGLRMLHRLRAAS